MGKNIKLTDGSEPSHKFYAFVEQAKSGFSTCRTCSKKIGQGKLRVHYGGGKYVHLRCWKGPPQQVGDDYFGGALTEEEKAQCAKWIEKHNAKKSNQAAAPVELPALTEKSVSVSSVRAAPAVANDADEISFGNLGSVSE